MYRETRKELIGGGGGAIGDEVHLGSSALIQHSQKVPFAYAFSSQV